jgi:hypothetical protein
LANSREKYVKIIKDIENKLERMEYIFIIEICRSNINCIVSL